MTGTAEPPAHPPAEPPGREGWLAMLRRRPTYVALAFAVLFWWESLSPTLMPRTPIAQAAISAVCLGFALVAGTFVGWLVRRMMLRFHWTVPANVRTILWIALGVIAAVTVVVGLLVWTPWQNDQRDLMGVAHIDASGLVPMVLVTLVLTVVLVVIGRIIWRGIRAIDRFASRYLRRTGATIATLVVVVVLFNWVGGALFNAFETWARDSFGEVDDGTDSDAVQPTEPTLSGSPDSLIGWDTLGREGRNFMARVTTEADLRKFHGADATVVRPVRIYAGLNSAPDATARAELAVQDLERAGGFDRKVLVVTTVTGTGWVDPDAATAIEQLYAGDTAMVGIQYSFLPSWISTLVDAEVAQQAGSELFNAVAARWAQLPADHRPTLLVFGQSLGSLGAEAAFAGRDVRTSVANIVQRSQGALFTGPTNSNAMWRQLVAARDAGSTAWLPVYDNGRSVRFANRNAEIIEPDATWQGPRILYIQHPSDPVTFWDVPTLWREPEWIQDPKGYDIPARAHWFPFVTWAQGVGDLAAGFGAKPGYGHDYSISFVAGWAAVAPPDGWTAADTRRLMEFLGKA